MKYYFLRCVCLFTICAVSLPACGPEHATEPVSIVEPRRAFVEKLLASGVDDPLRAEADTGISAKRVKRLIEHEATRGWRTRVRSGIKYADLFQKLYGARDYRKVASTYNGLTPKGRAILEMVKRSPEHALNTRYYPIKKVEKLDASINARASKDAQWKAVELTPKEAQLLVTWLNMHEIDVHAPDTTQRLMQALVGPSEDATDEEKAKILPSPVPRITAQVRAFRDALKSTAKDGAALEMHIVDMALRYARDMKHFNLAGMTWGEMKRAGGSKVIIYERLHGFFDALVAAPAKDVRGVLTALEPTHAQYHALRKARMRYAAVKEAGGWPRVTPVYLSEGKSNPVVARLKRRLWMEGYLKSPTQTQASGSSTGLVGPKLDVPPEFSPKVDLALIAAAKRYRRTHQLGTKGSPGRIFWKSLNVPVERRLEQIDVNINRWRTSLYKGQKDYILVNLPEFHAESYQDHKIAHRFKVIVGKNNRTCDPKTARWIYPNATPELASQLEYFIINPSWFVPDRIVREEIIPYMEDEAWMAWRDYEVVSKKGDSYVIRQNPGPKNALGKVKFIFPNPHNTYMHDTPKKQYFKMKIRSQSHGCMRVHEPLKFAKHLVKVQSLEDKYDVDDLASRKDPKLVRMTNPIPVFVEYHTVRVDDEGYPHFFIDVYYKDRLAIAGRKDHGPCTPPAPKEDGKPSGGDDIGP